MREESQRLEGAYRRDLLVFGRALKNGEAGRVKRAAQALLRYIEDCGEEEVGNLKQYVDGSEK